jgi:hydrogenase maturation factor HypF (carbamoyltransferase family)
MRILIRGTVQGVGFRPMVYRVAKSLGLSGYVLNKGSNVEIGIKEDEKVEKFLTSLMKGLPPLASIDETELKDKPIGGYEDFKILNNAEGIIMTSANISGEPMVTKNEDAFLLNADYLLLHNREIVNRIDE